MSNTLEQVIQDPERLRRVRETGLLDAPTDAAFDRLTRLAARLLNAPVSTVTLVDSDRQFHMSCAGMPEPIATERVTPLEFSFCKHTVVLGRPLIIPDTRVEPIVAGNPSITEFGVTAYAGIPLLTSGGQALGTLCVMDYKVRHWTEEEISSLTDLAASVSTEIELRMDLAARARVQQELQNTVRLRDEVLGIVSHDLRNPVHTIQLSSGFLLDTLPDDGSQELTRRQISVIRRAAQRMDRMIGDLLDAATIAAGHLSMEPRPHSAALLLRTACDSLAPLAKEKGIHFVTDGPEDAPAVMADVDRIVQLLGNLVGNAVRFTAEGGTITLGLRLLDATAEFRVADTGTGIPADELPRVFDQFWQARRDGRQGTGLGLTIAQGIVHAHGGDIRVESTPGKGTTFFFTLPYAGG